MKYDPFYIADLLLRSNTEGLPKEEQEILDQWQAAAPENQQLVNELEDPEISRRDWEDFERFDPEEGWKRLQVRLPKLRLLNYDGTWAKPAPLFSGRYWYWIYRPRRSMIGALAGVVLVLVAVFFYHNSSSQNNDPQGVDNSVNLTTHSIMHRASFQLAGGPIQELASLALGLIVKNGSVNIYKTGDGEIDFTPAAGGNEPLSQERACQVSTPPGGLFSAILTDRTRVDLNVGSTLQLHEAFGRPTREVTLDGEAYFNVAPDKGNTSKPFVVHVRSRRSNHNNVADTSTLDIVSLGTSFNVKAYGEDGRILTTLDQGTIQLKKDGQELLLKQGESAMLNDSGELVKEKPTSKPSAWKDGIFDLSQQPANLALTEIARWYNVKIKYMDRIPTEICNLQLPRSLPLSTVLDKVGRQVQFLVHIKADTLYVSH